jgi:hypothetical protein
MRQISREIDLFIRARVRGVAANLRLEKDKQDMLLDGLLGVPHRTYLWVYLTLDLVESDDNINKGEIKQAISQLPKSVDEAYERVLLTSRDAEEARKALITHHRGSRAAVDAPRDEFCHGAPRFTQVVPRR